MSPEDAFRAHLVADPTVSPYIGDRVHHGTMPQRSWAPCCRYFRIGGEDLVTHGGTLAAGSCILQVEIWAVDLDQAQPIAGLVKTSILTLTGRLGGASGVRIGYREVKALPDGYDPDTKLFARKLSVYFDYWEN